MAEIVVEGLRKEFDRFVAVHRSSFTVADGEFFMLLGPSGCGKTTTLRMIAGLELPTEGQIRIGGTDVAQVPASKRDIAFVFQLFALYPHLSVRRNIAYPLASQGVGRSEIRTRVEEVAALLGIAHLLDRGVGGLSGGDRQRVALGRAIVRRPQAFLMDEPLGALDAEFREQMAAELRALHDRIGATTVYVTHDQLEAMQMGDKIAVMNQGRVEQLGPPQDVYDRPATLFVADFIGSPPMNLLPFEGQIAPGGTQVRLNGGDVTVPASRAGAEGRLVLGVRPEHVELIDPGPEAALTGRVISAEYLGTTQIVTVETGLGLVRARLPSGTPAGVGATAGLAFAASRISLFAAETGRVIPSALHDGGGSA